MVTVETVEAARPDFDERRDVYYRQRHRELARRRLLRAASAVAAAFGARDFLSDDELDVVVRRGLDAEPYPGTATAEDALTELRHLGFIWQPRPDPAWEPGIPSLMDYIRKYVPAP